MAGNGTRGDDGDAGPAVEAQLNRPHSIAFDSQDRLYIADIGNHRIRRVDWESGIIHSIAGTGAKELPKSGQLARDHPVLGPRALFIRGDVLWVALREGHSIWKIDLAQGTWQHVAGSGEKGFTPGITAAADARFNGPKGLAIGPTQTVYVVDTENQVIRAIDPQRQTVSTLAGQGPEFRGFGGDGDLALTAMLNRPHGICVDNQGRVYIGDSENHRVRLVGKLPATPSR